MVTAHVVEGAKHTVSAANHDNGFSSDEGGNELAGRMQLIGTRNELPGLAEDAEAFEFGDARIGIPRCGNGGGLRERCAIIVTGKNLIDGR